MKIKDRVEAAWKSHSLVESVSTGQENTVQSTDTESEESPEQQELVLPTYPSLADTVLPGVRIGINALHNRHLRMVLSTGTVILIENQDTGKTSRIESTRNGAHVISYKTLDNTLASGIIEPTTEEP